MLCESQPSKASRAHGMGDNQYGSSTAYYAVMVERYSAFFQHRRRTWSTFRKSMKKALFSLNKNLPLKKYH